MATAQERIEELEAEVWRNEERLTTLEERVNALSEKSVPDGFVPVEPVPSAEPNTVVNNNG